MGLANLVVSLSPPMILAGMTRDGEAYRTMNSDCALTFNLSHTGTSLGCCLMFENRDQEHRPGYSLKLSHLVLRKRKVLPDLEMLRSLRCQNDGGLHIRGQESIQEYRRTNDL